MKYVPVEECLDASKGSAYKLALLLAKRGRDLAEGEKTVASSFDEDKPLKAAAEEIITGKVKLK